MQKKKKSMGKKLQSTDLHRLNSIDQMSIKTLLSGYCCGNTPLWRHSYRDF